MADWTEIEVELIVKDYFDMLLDELAGKPINKSQHRKELKKLINRTDGSIEFKHQNISAVLKDLNCPYIKGYLPKPNIQTRLLPRKVLEYLESKKFLFESAFLNFTRSDLPEHQSLPVFSEFIVDPPKATPLSEPIVDYVRRPFKANYLELEQSNSMLGMRGEELVIEFEKWRLTNAGKDSLAERIEWVSKDDDAAGFDILSKNDNGTDRYIEVKTTKLNRETPIFFSKNEYDFSLEKNKNYHLYRLFNFSESPKMFRLKGSFDDICYKEPVKYKGYFS